MQTMCEDRWVRIQKDLGPKSPLNYRYNIYADNNVAKTWNFSMDTHALLKTYVECDEKYPCHLDIDNLSSDLEL